MEAVFVGRTDVRHQNNQKEMAKFVKKCLTIGEGYANICKLSDERLRNSPEEREIMKISEKQVKKGLDKSEKT